MAGDRHLTVEELADREHTTPETVRYWLKNGRGPRSIKPGRRRLFPLAEVVRWEREMLANGGVPKDAA